MDRFDLEQEIVVSSNSIQINNDDNYTTCSDNSFNDNQLNSF